MYSIVLPHIQVHQMMTNFKTTSVKKKGFYKMFNTGNNINFSLKATSANSQNLMYCNNCNYYIPTPF